MNFKPQIPFSQIISQDNHNSSQNELDSLRFSQDYVPFARKNSKSHQYEEVDFNFEPELTSEDSFKVEQVKSNQRQIENVKTIIQEELMEQSNVKKGCSRKKDIFMKYTKGKGESKPSLDTTQKYGQLFDQIFHLEKVQKGKENPLTKPKSNEKQVQRSKSSQKMKIKITPPIKQKEDKQERDMKSTKDSSASTPILIQDVIQANQNLKLPDTLQPKINITYAPKIMIQIKSPAKKPVPSPTSSNKPTIKFNYTSQEQTKEQTQTKQHQSPKASQQVKFQIKTEEKQNIKETNKERIFQYHVSEDERLPLFINKLRKITSFYPNFCQKNVLTPQFCKHQNQKTQQIIQEFTKVITILKQVHLKIREKIYKITQFYKKLNTNKQKQQQINYFLSTKWQTFINLQQLDLIQPRQIFTRRQFKQLEFIMGLSNYEVVINNFKESQILETQNKGSIQKYGQFRQKLWQIEKNLRVMSQDLYCFSLKAVVLPRHIYDCHIYLTEKEKLKGQISAEKKKFWSNLLDRLLFLQDKNDIFSNSFLGHQIVGQLIEIRQNKDI